MTRAASLARLAVALTLAGCGRERFAAAPFALVGHDFGAPDGAKLNQPLVLSFNDDVDPGSARPGTVRVVRESDGGEVPGRLHAAGATLVFEPRLPLACDLADVALRPGERYRVEVPGLPVLRSLRGLARGALEQGAALTFSTLEFTGARAGMSLADAPAELLFVDPVAGAPSVLRGARGEEPRLSSAGAAALRFSEPLDPRSLARSRFWLDGPWRRSTDPPEKKPAAMTARLTGNEPQAVVELALAAAPPAPLMTGVTYQVEYEPAILTDFAGHALALRNDPDDSFVPLQFKP